MIVEPTCHEPQVGPWFLQRTCYTRREIERVAIQSQATAAEQITNMNSSAFRSILLPRAENTILMSHVATAQITWTKKGMHLV